MYNIVFDTVLVVALIASLYIGIVRVIPPKVVAAIGYVAQLNLRTSLRYNESNYVIDSRFIKLDDISLKDGILEARVTYSNYHIDGSRVQNSKVIYIEDKLGIIDVKPALFSDDLYLLQKWLKAKRNRNK